MCSVACEGQRRKGSPGQSQGSSSASWPSHCRAKCPHRICPQGTYWLNIPEEQCFSALSQQLTQIPDSKSASVGQLPWNNVQLASLRREQRPVCSEFCPFLFLLMKIFKVLRLLLLVWRTWSSRSGWEARCLFYCTEFKCGVQGCGMHFIMMIQLLSDHEQANDAASSLLQLTHPVFSFWLGSLNYISIALTIIHQRRLKRVQPCSIWNMSSTLQHGGYV